MRSDEDLFIDSLPMIFFWLVFVYMVVEDFRYRTVDLRCVVLLILFSSAGAENLQKYFIALTVSLLIFRVIYLWSAKIYEKNFVSEEKFLNRRTRHGYLPSLGVSLILYFAFEKIFSPPEFLKNYVEFFEMILKFPEIFGATIILSVTLWLVLDGD